MYLHTILDVNTTQMTVGCCLLTTQTNMHNIMFLFRNFGVVRALHPTGYTAFSHSLKASSK